MAASMRRIFAVSSVFMRGYLSRTNLQKSVGLGLLSLEKSSQCAHANKLGAVAVRRWCSQEADSQESVKKDVEPSDLEITAGIAYIQSEEYKEKYGERPVFANYRRNHKGRVAPQKTRKLCVRGSGENLKVAGNPCPICRDQELLLHYKNVKLLEQFICPHSREVYSDTRTGVCQKQYKKLRKVITEARNHGLIPFTVPFVEYNYEDYYGKKKADTTAS